MDFLLATVLLFGIFEGFNAHPSGNFNFVCREGEEYDMCRSPCEPTCDSIKRRIRQNSCPRPCIAGCFCRNGFVRAKDNTCVPPEECIRPQCPENEEYQECGSPCALNCTNIHEGIFCSKPCHKGCFCKSNFVRDARGKCVDPRSCIGAGHQQCPVNEHYVNCINYCNTCWENPYCTTSHCTPGCDCKPGYFRNSYGYCVTAEECSYSQYDVQEPCGANEVYTSCVNACNDCVSRGRCDYEQYYCTPGCDCKQGYLRNERGVCVPERYCFSQCHENEVFLECGPACRSTCENYKRLRYHSCKQECVPGCFCRGNFVIGPNGKCISPEYCPLAPSECPPGESFYQCMPTCRTTCRSLSDSSGICSTECRPGCSCQPGLVRNDDGKCVRPAECTVHASPLCPPGEAYYNCVPCPNTCDNLNASCTKICRPGCACEKGLVRRRDGRCIQPSNCRIVCGPNQEYRSCAPACPPTCESLNQRPICTSRCIRGCFCKSGFVIGPSGKCIRRRQCPSGTGTDFEGRRGGTDEDSKNNTLTTNPSTETTQSATNVPQTEKSNASVPDSTDQTTTVSKLADAVTTSKVADTTTSSKAADTTAASKAADTTIASKAADTTTASKAADTTTASKAADTTTASKAAETTSKEAEAATTSKVEDTKTTSPKSENSPTTEKALPPTNTQENNATENASLVTNAAETSNAETTSAITTAAATVLTTLSGNATSVNSTATG